MWIVLEIETHPDRCIDEAFGPFDDVKAAEQFAEVQYNRPLNLLEDGGHRYNYRAMSLTSPSCA